MYSRFNLLQYLTYSISFFFHMYTARERSSTIANSFYALTETSEVTKIVN